jgi:hypothetical protein
MAENISGMAVSKPVVEVAVANEAVEAERRRLVRIKRAIRRKTSGGIAELAVDVQGESLVIRGRCASFYYKQIAQEACMSQVDGQMVVNEIQVDVRPR